MFQKMLKVTFIFVRILGMIEPQGGAVLQLHKWLAHRVCGKHVTDTNNETQTAKNCGSQRSSPKFRFA